MRREDSKAYGVGNSVQSRDGGRGERGRGDLFDCKGQGFERKPIRWTEATSYCGEKIRIVPLGEGAFGRSNLTSTKKGGSRSRRGVGSKTAV